jgi:hypothetical protein
MEKLTSFYRSVHPAGSGWRPVARASGIPERTGEIWPNVLNWLMGIALVYATLFGIGEFIFGTWPRVLMFAAIAAVAGGIMIWNLNRTGWAGLSEGAEPRVGDIVAEGAD